MPEPEVKPEPAVFDPKAVETMIQGAVKTSLESLIKEGAARQQQKADDDAAAEADQKAEHQIGDVVGGVGP